MTSRFRMAGATAAILAVAVLTSCATGVGAPRGSDTGLAGDAGAMIVPGVTAEDWVTYGDHVLLLTAVSENEVPATQDEIDAGEGIIGREVVLKVEEVLWSRADAPRAPETVTFSWGGWSFREGEENQPIEYADGVSLDVGQTATVDERRSATLT